MSIDALPSNGTVDLGTDGSFTYVPAPGYVGSDSFTYIVSDGNTTSAAETVTINVIQNPTDFTVTIKEVTTGSEL